MSDHSAGDTDRFEEDATPCEECGELIDFTKATAYWKTSDEQFWHDDCYDATWKIDRLEDMRDEILSDLMVPEDCFDGLDEAFHLRLDNIQAEMDEAVRRERLRQEQDLVTDGGAVEDGNERSLDDRLPITKGERLKGFSCFRCGETNDHLLDRQLRRLSILILLLVAMSFTTGVVVGVLYL